MQPSEEIKQKLDIVDVIREYLPLKPAGMNFRAPCPFHREKTPSFMVSPDKQIWHCFGCGKGGDIFSFIEEIEGIEFVEAMRLLAPKAGVVLKRQDPQSTSRRNRLLDILDLASRFYHKVLVEAAEAKAAREYLAERGLTEETIEDWQIGYSPNQWDTISKRLRGKNYSEKEIFLSGMSVKSNNSSRFYDRFRGRIMFPIRDINGNTVAFSARVSPEREAEEKMGKYINSPQTEIYDKSKIVFGLDKAKLEIKKQGLAVMVEGQMDVITAHQFGYKNVIASSGTALSADQISILKRYTTNIALAFDMDEAGSLAADRGIQTAMQAEMNIKVVELPSGKDPDECIRQDEEGWKRSLESAKPMMQYFLDKTLAGLDLSKIADRREAAKLNLPIIAKLGNRIERDFWLRTLSEKIDVEESILRETLANVADKPAKDTDKRSVAKTKELLSKEEQLSELLMALLIKFPSFLEYSINRLQIEQLAGAANRNIYRNMIFYYNKVITDNDELRSRLEANDLGYNQFREFLAQNSINERPDSKAENIKDYIDQPRVFDRLVLLGDKEYYEIEAPKVKGEIISVIVKLKRLYLRQRMREITQLIFEAEKNKNNSEAKALTEEFKLLSDELKELE